MQQISIGQPPNKAIDTPSSCGDIPERSEHECVLARLNQKQPDRIRPTELPIEHFPCSFLHRMRRTCYEFISTITTFNFLLG